MIPCCALDSLHRVIWHVQATEVSGVSGVSGKGRVFFLAGVDLTKITHGDHPRCASLMRIFQCFSSPSVSQRSCCCNIPITLTIADQSVHGNKFELCSAHSSVKPV